MHVNTVEGQVFASGATNELPKRTEFDARRGSRGRAGFAKGCEYI